MLKFFIDFLIYLIIFINRPETYTFNKNLIAGSVFANTFFDLLLFPLLLSSSDVYTSLLIYKSDIKILNTGIKTILKLIIINKVLNFSLNIPVNPFKILRFIISIIIFNKYFL